MSIFYATCNKVKINVHPETWYKIDLKEKYLQHQLITYTPIYHMGLFKSFKTFITGRSSKTFYITVSRPGHYILVWVQNWVVTWYIVYAFWQWSDMHRVYLTREVMTNKCTLKLLTSSHHILGKLWLLVNNLIKYFPLKSKVIMKTP